MHCVAEWIENGRQLVGNIVGDLESVESRDRQVFGKRARPVNADARCIAAQVPTARPAIPAIAASDMPFARNAVANSEAADLLPYFHDRSEEHTSELQSLMRISYAVFCLKKKKNKTEI